MRVIDLDDPDDPRLDDVRALNHPTRRPDLRGGAGLVIAEGVYVVGRMLTSRLRTRCLVGTPGRLDRLRADARAEGWDADVAADGAPYYRVSREVLSEVIGFASQRDMVAAADRPEPLSVSEAVAGARTIVVLEGVNNAENLGAIFRGVAAFGADAVLFGAATGDPFYRRVVRVSMGHVLRVPFARMEGTPTTWQRGLTALREQGFGVVALTPNAEETVASAVGRLAAETESARLSAGTGPGTGGADGPPGRVALLVGAEGPGLTEHAMRAADVRASIPMAPGTDSLNVATATTLALYERFRDGR